VSTTKEASERSIEARLGEAGRRIDGIVAKARHTQDNGKERVGRRVDSLRARPGRGPGCASYARRIRLPGTHTSRSWTGSLTSSRRSAWPAAPSSRSPVRWGDQGLRLQLSGGSRVTADLGLDRADTTVSGGSHLQLTGAAEGLEADATGASDLELTGLSLQHLTVRLSGASHAKVQADQTIAAQVSGASSLTYLGTPRFTKRDASANSTIRSA
jgi:Putative auto-transporter adhesin, head GIN domain